MASTQACKHTPSAYLNHLGLARERETISKTSGTTNGIKPPPLANQMCAMPPEWRSAPPYHTSYGARSTRVGRVNPVRYC